MILLVKGKTSGPEVYRRRGMPAPAAMSGNVQDLLTPAHPNRSNFSGGLVLRAGINVTREIIVYYQADGDRKSASDAWKYYRAANTDERRMIFALLAENEIVEVETSFGFLLFTKSEEAG